MPESPRLRRLRSDLAALSRLAAESSIFTFTAHGEPPDLYVLRFTGRGLWRAENSGEVLVHEAHEVHIRLGASYPRMMPELAWKSPIFHPNISASGVVCLGGYGTYWVPSLTLDELCSMLWDMIRYENYDETSPYNREAAGWVKNQDRFRLPIDQRPLRDRLAGFAPAAEGAAKKGTQVRGREPGTKGQKAGNRQPEPASRGQGTGGREQESEVRSQGVPTRETPPVEAEVIFLDDTPQLAAAAPTPARADDGILFIE
ncbi:MAG: ubiquitin-conjugating enzyme E2 [Pirellulaceae bacterium]|nr:ubiquitin-conjugating enzyme E2 [Pirellulaceae bacterium]